MSTQLVRVDRRALDRGKNRRAALRESESAKYRWWRGDEDTTHDRVWVVAKRLWDQNRRYRTRLLYNSLMYGDVDPFLYFDAQNTLDEGRSYVRYNLVKNIVHTAMSLVGKNRPRPLFMPDGGTHDDLRKGEALTRWCGGVYDDARIHEKGEVVFRDAALHGDGHWAHRIDKKKKALTCDRVFPANLLIDEVEGAEENPPQIHERRILPRETVWELYGGNDDEIDRAIETAERVQTRSRLSVSDSIVVLESYHLPSCYGAKNGLRSVCLQGATLEVEEWNEDWFPYVTFRWAHSALGFRGEGIADEVGNIQRSVNRILCDIDESIRLFAVPLIFEPAEAQISEDDLLVNEIARRVRYYGAQVPQFATPQAMSPDVYAHAWKLVSAAYDMTGVNQSTAQGDKQPGLESGEAIREAQDVTGGRLQPVGQRWESAHMQNARVITGQSKRLFAAGSDIEILAKGKRGGLDRIKWSDINLGEDAYRLDLFEISSLPNTPQAKMQALNEQFDRELITREEYRELSNMPDTEEERRRATSSLDHALSVVAAIKKTGKYDIDTMAPPPEIDGGSCYKIVQQEIVAAQLEQVPAERIALLRTYLDAIADQMNRQAALPPPGTPPAPPAPPPGQGPPGPGGPPPGPPQQQQPPQAA
jgi:hypothetical protein